MITYKIHKAVRILCDSQQMGKGRQNDTWYPTVTKSGRTNQRQSRRVAACILETEELTQRLLVVGASII